MLTAPLSSLFYYRAALTEEAKQKQTRPACLFSDRQQRSCRDRCLINTHCLVRPATTCSSGGSRKQDWQQQHEQANTYVHCLTALLLALSPPSEARIVTEQSVGSSLSNQSDQVWQAKEFLRSGRGAQLQLPAGVPAAPAKPPASGGLSVREQVAQVRQLTSQAQTAAEAGDYQQALQWYTQIVRGFPELAITEYARIDRALMLYECGRASQAMLELEDEEVALTGYAEVHAALAAMIYSERPQQISRAEQQWDVAVGFDSRVADLGYLQQQKHWPPRMVEALSKFLDLR